ncbi:MAG TPA: TetR/AcrR family transcriptional regulator [Xanthobacteraceae bacterium]|jgi:AcrR family transcriptional regulator|nr:TetR/AcrR family transcriptional regulator [Xanthobacteraceae bacterium]
MAVTASTRRRRTNRRSRAGRPRRAVAAAGPRANRRAERRQAILAAALREFSARGFAAARLDDVAEAAGIAKGTIYLYFRDKEALFQDLIRSEMGPVVGTLEFALGLDLPAREAAEQAIELFVREIYSTERKDIIRLVISEGPRFPHLAAFYYREVVSRGIAAVRALLVRALERGELRNDAVIRFPQLLVAPGIVAIIWSGLFERQDPLDVRALMRAHLDLLFGEGRPK